MNLPRLMMCYISRHSKKKLAKILIIGNKDGLVRPLCLWSQTKRFTLKCEGRGDSVHKIQKRFMRGRREGRG